MNPSFPPAPIFCTPAVKHLLTRMLLYSLFILPATALAQPADTLLVNGKILTVDEDFAVVEALAIRAGRIFATGDSNSIRFLAGSNTQIIDLDGRTVVPGLIDNHFHFLRAVQRWHLQARLDGVNSRTQALQILADKATASPPGQWVIVQGGWSRGQFADAPGGFTLEELDRVAPANPLFIQENYNTIYANSLALRAVALDPADGAMRPAEGLATFNPPYGRLIQNIPDTSPAQLEQNLSDLMLDLNKSGLTALYSLGRGPEGEESVLERRATAGTLSLRIWHTLTFEASDSAAADAAAKLINANAPNTFNGDYGLYGLGEHLYLPFFDFPSQNGSWSADILDNYMKIARTAALGFWHIHEHTMSNFSISDLLARFELLNENVRMDDLRWTLAHVYDISPDNIGRAKNLGMTFAVHGAAMHSAAEIPFRDIQDSGIIFGLGTDATIVSHYQPFVTLGWAVSGLDLAGKPVLTQTLTREEALVAHTRNNAWMFFQEDDLGSLESGKRADLVVLDRDYMTVPAQEIMQIKSLLTMVGGRVVWKDSDLEF